MKIKKYQRKLIQVPLEVCKRLNLAKRKKHINISEISVRAIEKELDGTNDKLLRMEQLLVAIARKLDIPEKSHE